MRLKWNLVVGGIRVTLRVRTAKIMLAILKLFNESLLISKTANLPRGKLAYLDYFSYFSTKTCVVGTQKNGLNETRSFEHPKHCLNWWVRKELQFYAQYFCLSKPDAYIHFSHLDSKTVEGFSTTGYFCPQCKSKYCELPIECKACGKWKFIPLKKYGAITWGNLFWGFLTRCDLN